ncbi:hypothetical protein C942_04123 [Photobacterium marinum]|uniref:Uncharacterized protein n=1 Tax=Photobacterium marinum TaxID=1056511 RepID=L8J657_9GAMM|nr:hypothetical protein C942_04123 [Photobacterium marinum]
MKVICSIAAFNSGNESSHYSSLHCNERLAGFFAYQSCDAALRNISLGCHANVFGSKL